VDAHKTESTPITFPALQAQARALAASGGSSTMVAGTIAGAISDLRAGLARQVDAHLQLHSERDALALIDPENPTTPAMNIRDFLGGTADAAGLRSKELGHEKASNAKRRVARLLDALGVLPIRAPNARHSHALPAAWSRLADLVSTTAPEDGEKAVRQRRAVATAIRHLGLRASSRGVLSPWALPDAYGALTALLKTWGTTNRAHVVWALRRAAEYVDAMQADLQPLPRWERTQPGQLSRERVRTAMPLFHEDIETWAEQATASVTARSVTSRSQSAHEALRPDTIYRYTCQAFQWANGLLDLLERDALGFAIDPATLTCENIWTTAMPHAGGAQRHASQSDRIAERRRREGVQCDASANLAPIRPLAVVVAELAVDATDIWPGAVRPLPSVLPASISQMLFALFSMAERVAVVTHGDNTDGVRALRASWTTEMRVLRDGLKRGAGSRKEPGTLLDLITLPQLVCVGLPWFTLLQLPALRERAAKAMKVSESPTVSAAAQRAAIQATRDYHSVLQRWLVLATFTAEPMRRANVSFARLGREIMIDAEWHADGSMIKLKKIASTFERHNKSDVRETETKTGAARDEWPWMPGIIARKWVRIYLKEFWLPALVVRGLVPVGTTLRDAVEAGRFAWIVNEDARAQGEVVVPGAFADASGVAAIFTDGLLDAIRAIGRDIPADRDACLARWPWVLGPHIIRTLWATYWFGLRGAHGPQRPRRDGTPHQESGIDIACRATNDSEATLRGYYVKVAPRMLNAQREPLMSFEHPGAFDAVMDEMWWLTPVDWSRVWRAPASPVPDALRRRYERHRAGGTPAGAGVRRRVRGRRTSPQRATAA
jgi:hypothetical protein